MIKVKFTKGPKWSTGEKVYFAVGMSGSVIAMVFGPMYEDNQIATLLLMTIWFALLMAGLTGMRKSKEKAAEKND